MRSSSQLKQLQSNKKRLVCLLEQYKTNKKNLLKKFCSLCANMSTKDYNKQTYALEITFEKSQHKVRKS